MCVEGDRELLFNGCRVSVLHDKKVLEMEIVMVIQCEYTEQY